MDTRIISSQCHLKSGVSMMEDSVNIFFRSGAVDERHMKMVGASRVEECAVAAKAPMLEGQFCNLFYHFIFFRIRV